MNLQMTMEATKRRPHLQDCATWSMSFIVCLNIISRYSYLEPVVNTTKKEKKEDFMREVQSLRNFHKIDNLGAEDRLCYDV